MTQPAPFQNRLAAEKSPYLQQHASNPIDWYPWGEEAFSKAAMENKPIFLSIGYATCHWCHVMEQDSFIKDDIASVLNEHFVAIKVDREERPDVDHIYMKALQAFTGHGGWPLSMLLTPDRQPFWGGTFVPRAQLQHFLQRVATLWQSPEQEKMVSTASAITTQLARPNLVEAVKTWHPQTTLQTFIESCREDFDATDGGFGDAPKFPPSLTLLALMRWHHMNDDCRTWVFQTLDCMARSGLRDHVGGGFHRYATDSAWLIPHFEKMLYDNCLLALCYTEAWGLSGNPDYKYIARETLDYIARDLLLPLGGVASAEDADSENTEGKFYVWHWQELAYILTPPELTWLAQNYHVKPEGNFSFSSHAEELEKAAGMGVIENGNILHRLPKESLRPEDTKLHDVIWEKLRVARKRRVRPLRDHKILTAWNGLALAAFSKAAVVWDDPHYREIAAQISSFIAKHLRNDQGELLRRYCDGESKYRAYLEDYSYLIFGLLEYYQLTLDAGTLDSAAQLQEHQDKLFWDHDHGGYFDSDRHDPHLLFAHKDYFDQATPNANALSVWNLVRLGNKYGNLAWREQASRIIGQALSLYGRYPRGFATLLCGLYAWEYAEDVVVAASTGPVSLTYLRQHQASRFHPSRDFHLPQSDSDVAILQNKRIGDTPGVLYLCRWGTCQSQPITDTLPSIP